MQELRIADGRIFKQLGSVLISQEKDDSITLVQKRLDFIRNELYTFKISYNSSRIKLEKSYSSLKSTN